MKNKYSVLLASLILSAGLSMGSAQAADNPFGMSDQVKESQKLAMSSKPKEGKCGGDKCGDGKDKDKDKDGKDKEKKCGKCGGS